MNAPVRYLSVCSGIEAASVAWKPLGWEAAAFAEIEAAPRAVLAHHWPEVPLHGDFTTIRADEYGPVRLLVGGTPCQSFSVAGLRGGLADDRGNLALEYLRLAQRLRPEWLVWENVPGVLSSSGGRDFGAILGGMVELGYGFAYRVLDAQYVRVDGHGRAVPQRRRRVFVVGHLGDWRRAAAVLFERACLRGDPAPRREAGQRPAPTLSARTQGGGGLGTDFDCDGGLVASPIAPAISASNPYGDHESREGLLVAHSLRGEGFDASEDGTGRGTPIVPVAGTLSCGNRGISPDQAAAAMIVPVAYGGNDTRGPIQVATAINAHGGPHGRLDFESETFIAFDCKAGADTGFAIGDLPGPLRGEGHGGGHAAVAIGHNGGPLISDWAVRRLTPLECERLQGFPDGHTAIPWRGGIMADGPRYKMLGNSMAVNVMRWIGRRIEAVDALPTALIPLLAAE